MTLHPYITRSGYLAVAAALLLISVGSFSEEVYSQIAKIAAQDPGVRKGAAGAGGIVPGVASGSLDQRIFAVGQDAFQEVGSVQGTIKDTEAGLGPRFNL